MYKTTLFQFFPDTHSCKELHSRSHCFALQNFQQVVNTEEFLLLPITEVRKYIYIFFHINETTLN